jgi:hypothetical protein
LIIESDGSRKSAIKKKRKPKQPPGTWVERELFQSKAFHSLGGFAPQLLILFLGKENAGF